MLSTRAARSCLPALPQASRATPSRPVRDGQVRPARPRPEHGARIRAARHSRRAFRDRRRHPQSRSNPGPGPARLDARSRTDRETYLHVLRQPRSAWTWEIELRPWVEAFEPDRAAPRSPLAPALQTAPAARRCRRPRSRRAANASRSAGPVSTATASAPAARAASRSWENRRPSRSVTARRRDGARTPSPCRDRACRRGRNHSRRRIRSSSGRAPRSAAARSLRIVGGDAEAQAHPLSAPSASAGSPIGVSAFKDSIAVDGRSRASARRNPSARAIPPHRP